jgi:5-formyltetrahydrofolate cyclo-ligase
MSEMHVSDIAAYKDEIRKQAHQNRREQKNKETLSSHITDRFISLPEYEAAAVVMFYVDVRSEVRTRNKLAAALGGPQAIAVPYCLDGELQLFLLEDMSELETGMYKILEPKEPLRNLPEKRVLVENLDVIMVPGVAFDYEGGRTGHGKGYYDKLLQNARPDTPLIALAFECQMFPEIPMAEHDIFMDQVITEDRIYKGRGRGEKAK